MKVSNGVAQFVKDVAARLNDQHDLRCLLDFTLPSIEALGARKYVHAGGEPMFK